MIARNATRQQKKKKRKVNNLKKSNGLLLLQLYNIETGTCLAVLYSSSGIQHHNIWHHDVDGYR